MFYHIKNLQSTKTHPSVAGHPSGFITLRIYKVLKLKVLRPFRHVGFITLRIYKVLKPNTRIVD